MNHSMEVQQKQDDSRATACMFLSSVTVVDHAYVSAAGLITGRSINPAFLVSGPVNAQENVVIDFSAVKKSIKFWIDKSDYALDHRLWVEQGQADLSHEGDRMRLDFNKFSVLMPQDAMQLLDGINKHEAGVHLGDMLTERLSEEYGTDIQVDCHPNMTNTHYWSDGGSHDGTVCYSHGLRQSSSSGCQNILHGHTSFFKILPAKGKRHDEQVKLKVADAIQRMYDGKYFAWDENIVSGNIVQYESMSRGLMRLEFVNQQAFDDQVVVFPHETTIEHLTSAVIRPYTEMLKDAGYGGFAFSEGLTKGAVVYF